MRMAVYSAREDEEPFFHHFAPEYGMEIVMIPTDPTPETLEAAAGCDCVSIVTKTHITPPMLDAYKAMGVRFLSTRTVGFEHIDVDYAEKIGMGVGNVGYTPYSVAEYAVMMMMMAMRHMKTMTVRAMGQDYGLDVIRGRLIHDATVGIVGTGKIGATVATILQGFGCKVLAYDLYQNPALEGMVEYVSMEELLRQSDIVTLHAPATADSFHMMNAQTIAMMKKGAVLVNTARGDLVDSEALITAIEEEHLGGAALDLVEGDRLIYYREKKGQQLKNRYMSILNGLPNVIMTPHMAFFTDHSVSDMVENSIRSSAEYLQSN
ncbi:NAD(P)-dependent oxidoreductase [Bengtsoniella intestinalis]|uniref:NAD(P)-dependent oxidoreductase n=1 Tax=Bengtsoniella intestinalis TaxID=3073143 RepID=UPI00391EE82E